MMVRLLFILSIMLLLGDCGIIFCEEGLEQPQPPVQAATGQVSDTAPEKASPEGGPGEAPVSTVEPNKEGMVWINGKLPENSETEGKWLWDENMKQDGVVSHTDGVSKGIHIHSFKTSVPLLLNKDSKIIQYVYLDPKKSPSGIMVKFMLEGQQEATVYWEGDEEVFADMDEYLAAWYIGFLPKSGEWTKLEININELEIAEARLNGVSFIANDGMAWWGKTMVETKNGSIQGGGRDAKEEA
jgi:hypothetical protein